MKKLWRLVYAFVLGGTAVFLAYLIIQFTGLRTNLPSGVTRQAVQLVQVDMTVDEVVAILGQPLSIELFDDGTDAHRQVMNYGRFVFPFRSFPMLWVHLQEGRVVSVYAEIHYGIASGRVLDETAVYSLDADRVWQTDEFEAIFPVDDN